MKKFLTIMILLTTIATPAFAQPMWPNNAAPQRNDYGNAGLAQAESKTSISARKLNATNSTLRYWALPRGGYAVGYAPSGY